MDQACSWPNLWVEIGLYVLMYYLSGPVGVYFRFFGFYFVSFSAYGAFGLPLWETNVNGRLKKLYMEKNKIRWKIGKE
jgi:hypothetical protein